MTRFLAVLLFLFGASPLRASVAGAQTIVPGGIRALAIAAHMRSGIPADLFALEYSQAILSNSEGTEGAPYVDGLRRYFQTVDSLKKVATVTPEGLELTLDARTFEGFYKVRDVLKLLGMTINGDIDPSTERVVVATGKVLAGKIVHVSVRLGTEPVDAERQAFSSGFGNDVFALKAALEGGAPYKLKVPSDSIPIALDETFWVGQAMNSKQLNGGVLQGFVDHLPVARLYIALGSISAETRRELLQTISADRLAKQYSDLLALYGSSLSVRSGQAEVPGGASAAAAWEKLAGISPARSGAFIEMMLRKDGGKLLAFHHTLSELPLSNQKFFTRTPERLTAFYNVFPFSEKELLSQHRLIRHDTQFFDLARELPLDNQGGVRFPGGEAAWATDHKASGVLRAALAADAEDQILLGLLSRADCESFLAVVRLERTWRVQLDAASASILAKNYPKYRSLYPYFFALPALSSADLQGFFLVVEDLDGLTHGDRTQADNALAEFHGVISLLTILNGSGGLSDRDTIHILHTFCASFSVSPGYTASALDTLWQIVAAVQDSKATSAISAASADDRLLDALVGQATPITFKSGVREWTVNRADWQKDRIRRVLAFQTVTSIQVLLDLFHSLSSTEDVRQTIERQSKDLIEIVPAAEDRLSPQDRDRLAAPRRSGVAFTDVDQLTPYLKSALVAWSYAYYAAPDDLLVSADRYLVRRHQFISAAGNGWNPTELQKCDGGGMCVVGGLAELGAAAGNWGRTKVDAAENLNSAGIPDLAVQAVLTSIRTVPWARVTPDVLHAVGVRLRLAKSIVGRAATDERTRNTVSEHLIGIVGSFRRLEIVQALADGEPKSALDLLSSSDLFFLAESIEPDAASLDAVNYFGGSHLQTYGSMRPLLVHSSPYEEYMWFLHKDALWDSVDHILLSIAEAADREGIPADAVAELSESALRQVGKTANARGPTDWLSVVRAMNRINLIELLPELDKRPR